MKYDDVQDVELGYRDDARSVHTLLRIIDPDSDRKSEVLFDNLTTPMYFIVSNDLKPCQETLGFVDSPTADDLGGGLTGSDRDALAVGSEADPGIRKRLAVSALTGWREHVSGPGNETLIIECYGDPSILTGDDDGN